MNRKKKLPKYAVVVGHNSKRQGAVMVDRTSEYKFNSDVAAQMLLRSLDEGMEEIEVFRRDPSAHGYRAQIRDVYDRVNDWGPDLVLELHFNSSEGSPGDYTTVLFAKGSEDGEAAAALFSAEIADGLQIPNKGSWGRTLKQAGGGSLFGAKAPCILLEPFFGNNPDHCERVINLGGAKYVAEIYLNALRRWGGVFAKQGTPDVYDGSKAVPGLEPLIDHVAESIQRDVDANTYLLLTWASETKYVYMRLVPKGLASQIIREEIMAHTGGLALTHSQPLLLTEAQAAELEESLTARTIDA